MGRLELHPGAWIGSAVSRLVLRDGARELLLNALTPAERLSLAATALAWEGRGPELDHEAARIALELARTSDPGHVAVELARAVEGPVREGIFAQVRTLLEGDGRSLAYGLRLFASHHRQITLHARGVAGRRILELGPGYSLAPGLLLVAAGAASWTGVDPFPIATRDAAHYRALREEVLADRGVVRGTDHEQASQELLRRLDLLMSCEGDQVQLDGRRVRMLRASADALPLADGSQDVVISNAVLEHVRDPAAVVRESMRVLAPGGIGVHQIDLRDHRDFSRPLEFLCLRAEEWERGFATVPFDYTNRWRASEFLSAFRAAGAEVLQHDVTLTARLDAGLRARLAPEFRAREAADLEALSLALVVRRPA